MATIFGTNGADTRDGTGTADLIQGGPSPNPATDTGNDTLSGLGGNDTINGYGGDDSLDGGDGNDTLNGGNGNDTLYGDSGINTFTGGAGDDTLVADNIGTVAGFDGGIGTDTLFLAFDTTLASTALLTSVERIERAGFVIKGTNDGNVLDFSAIAGFDGGVASGLNLFGAGGDDSITGTALNDVINGAVGNDTLAGSGGGDDLYGGSGTNTLLGGEGDDYLFADNLGFIGSFDGGNGTDGLVFETDITLDGTSRLASIERVYSYDGSTIQGTNLDNVLDFTGIAVFGDPSRSGLRVSGAGGDDAITGTAQGDTLRGDLGNDTLRGGAGDDQLDGGLGDDTYMVDSASDVLIDAGGVDTVVAAVDWTLGASFEDLVLADGEVPVVRGIGNGLANRITGNGDGNALTGGNGNDTLDGGLGSDTLNGGSGLDSMRGGAGNDIYIVQQVDDVVDEAGGGGTDSVTAYVSFTLADGVENLTLVGTGDLAGTGGADVNRIRGNTGANLLSGGGGNDALTGGAGNDTLVGGLGADRLLGEAGMDTFRYASAAEGRDVITAFVSLDDTIEVSASGFGGDLTQGSPIGAHFAANDTGLATAATGQFVYETDVGRLWWDADGTGAGSRVLLATLVGSPGLTAGDIVVIA